MPDTPSSSSPLQLIAKANELLPTAPLKAAYNYHLASLELSLLTTHYKQLLESENNSKVGELYAEQARFYALKAQEVLESRVFGSFDFDASTVENKAIISEIDDGNESGLLKVWVQLTSLLLEHIPVPSPNLKSSNGTGTAVSLSSLLKPSTSLSPSPSPSAVASPTPPSEVSLQMRLKSLLAREEDDAKATPDVSDLSTRLSKLGSNYSSKATKSTDLGKGDDDLTADQLIDRVRDEVRLDDSSKLSDFSSRLSMLGGGSNKNRGSELIDYSGDNNLTAEELINRVRDEVLLDGGSGFGNENENEGEEGYEMDDNDDTVKVDGELSSSDIKKLLSSAKKMTEEASATTTMNNKDDKDEAEIVVAKPSTLKEDNKYEEDEDDIVYTKLCELQVLIESALANPKKGVKALVISGKKLLNDLAQS